MNKIERMKEIMKASPNFGKGVSYKMCVVDEFHDMEELLEENAKLKAYNEKLLNSDIEKHNKIVELREQIQKMKCCSNCNGIVMGGIRTEKCKVCIRSKDFPEWELKG